MLKIKSKIFLILLLLSFFPLTARAIDVLAPLSSAGIGIINPLQCEDIICLIILAINFLLMIGLAVFPIMILSGAFYFITSAGNPERVQKAKRIIFNTIIGLLVILSARMFVAVMQSILS
jgi:hypothetical protein